jgi:prepilin-type N-terminal cleavage/methylation domain-containing protein
MTMSPLRRARRGFTIVEIITALTIVAILGIAMTKLVIGQARSFQLDNGSRKARAAARSAMNILITDLRMTQDNGGVTGLDATNNRRIDVRVPLVFGVVCEVNSNNVVLSLVPADSFQVANSKYAGFAIRQTSGIYANSVASSSDTIQATGSGRCHGGGVSRYADTITSNGRAGTVMLAGGVPPAGTLVGDLAFVYQTVTYEFKTSLMYPGGLGLYRTLRGRANQDTRSEELLAPFMTGSRFSYYTIPFQSLDRPTLTAPTAANYNTVRGFQITLAAQAPDTAVGRTTPKTATTTTAVFFKNTTVQ